MKRFSIFLSLTAALFATALFLNSCQKESLQTTNPTQPNVSAGERDQLSYGVTVFRPGVPSQLITLETATGNVQNNVQVFVLDANNNPVFINDLKGVCVYQGQVWVTTGPNVIDAYNNMLLKVNPNTGQAGVISYSDKGTVSDIDYDANTNTVYGLLNNSNSLVTINDLGNNWGTYTIVGNITNLGNGYTAKGLSMARDANGDRIIIAATQALGGNARIYAEPATAGAANLLTTVLPAANLAAANCGIGFQIDLNSMLINRQPTSGAGANSFAWANAFAANTTSAFWGGNGWNFEDLSSDIQ